MDHLERKIYGMVHLAPLPGTPYYKPNSFKKILAKAVDSALKLQSGGAHGCLVQSVDRVYNSNDTSDPARTAAAGIIVNSIVDATDFNFAVGIQLMKNSIIPSLAIAKVAGGGFIRATALVGFTYSDYGLIEADPYKVMECRRSLGANDIDIITDIASIHHHPYKTVGELARDAKRIGADAVAIGNPQTETTLQLIEEVRNTTPNLPIFLAGHSNHSNAATLLLNCKGAFVGSCFESCGWGGQIDENKVKTYMKIVHSLPPTKQS